MANTWIAKKSSEVGKVPTSAQLEVGEIAVNLADQKIYTKNASNQVILIGSGESGGGGGGGITTGKAIAMALVFG